MAPRKWGFDLKSNSTSYPDHGHHGDPPPTRKNPHARAGNRTRDLVISSQKLWPLDHEAGLLKVRLKGQSREALQTTSDAQEVLVCTCIGSWYVKILSGLEAMTLKNVG